MAKAGLVVCLTLAWLPGRDGRAQTNPWRPSIPVVGIVLSTDFWLFQSRVFSAEAFRLCEIRLVLFYDNVFAEKV